MTQYPRHFVRRERDASCWGKKKKKKNLPWANGRGLFQGKPKRGQRLPPVSSHNVISLPNVANIVRCSYGRTHQRNETTPIRKMGCKRRSWQGQRQGAVPTLSTARLPLPTHAIVGPKAACLSYQTILSPYQPLLPKAAHLLLFAHGWVLDEGTSHVRVQFRRPACRFAVVPFHESAQIISQKRTIRCDGRSGRDLFFTVAHAQSILRECGGVA